MEQEHPGPPLPPIENEEEDLDGRLQEIDIHEAEEEESEDSGEGSIILVNDDDRGVDDDIDVDDGVALDDTNSDDMETDDLNDPNLFVNEDRVGGNHPLVRFKIHKASVFWSDIEPVNKEYAVTGGQDDRAVVWNLNSGDAMLECGNHTDSVICVGFSYDGIYVATGDMSGLIQVWKLFENEPVWSEKIDELQWLLWHRESNILFAAQKTGEIFFWKIPSGECKVIAGHGKETECAALMPDGKRLIVGYSDKCTKVFDLKSESAIAVYKSASEHDEAATDVDVSADNTNFVVGFTDGSVLVGSSWANKILFELETKTKVESVKFVASDVSPLIAIGSSIGVQIWDYSKKVLRNEIECSAINRLLYDSSRNLLYSGGVTGEIYVISCLSGSIIYYFVGHRSNILHLSISKDCKKMLSTSDDTRANVYDLTVLDTLAH